MPETTFFAAGQRLRRIREQLGLTLREVEAASHEIARLRQDSNFVVPISRLSEIERRGMEPSIFRLYSLSVVYKRDLRELLSFYGVVVEEASEHGLPPLDRTHPVEHLDYFRTTTVPIRLDPALDLKQTQEIATSIQQWGPVPFALLKRLAEQNYLYVNIGQEDRTMFPILRPGALVQVDPSSTTVDAGPWESEYARPLYLIETRSGYLCSWCCESGQELHVQPHPLSGVKPQTFRLPHEAEVIGRVVGIAMQLRPQQK
jgi:transcriptional regulator with XRE-family HTH domain